MTPGERAKYVYYNGDRILVSKFAYDFSPPERWDVIVFKYPEDAKTNYIKRLIGLPNDVIRIRDGDIAVSHDDGKTFAYRRAVAGKLRSMLQMVYDDDFAFRPFVDEEWPAALESDRRRRAAWTAVASNSKDEYRRDGVHHDRQTSRRRCGRRSVAALFALCSDAATTGINSSRACRSVRRSRSRSPMKIPTTRPFRSQLGDDVPVDDLAVEFQVDVQQAQGKLAIELVKQGQPFRCVLDLSDGTAELAIPGWTATTAGSDRRHFENRQPSHLCSPTLIIN